MTSKNRGETHPPFEGQAVVKGPKWLRDLTDRLFGVF